jgi:hypothetical protein
MKADDPIDGSCLGFQGQDFTLQSNIEEPTGPRQRLKLQLFPRLAENSSKRDNKHRRLNSLNLVAQSIRSPPKKTSERVRFHLPNDLSKFQSTIQQSYNQLNWLKATENGKNIMGKTPPFGHNSKLSFQRQENKHPQLTRTNISPHQLFETSKRSASPSYSISNKFRNQLLEKFGNGSASRSPKIMDQSHLVQIENHIRTELLKTIVHLVEANTPVDCILKFQSLMIEDECCEIDTRQDDLFDSTENQDPEITSANFLSYASTDRALPAISKQSPSRLGSDLTTYQNLLFKVGSLMSTIEEIEIENITLENKLEKWRNDKTKIDLLEKLYEEKNIMQELIKSFQAEENNIDNEIQKELELSSKLEAQLNIIENSIEASLLNDYQEMPARQKYSFARLGSKLKQPTLSSTHLPVSEEAGQMSTRDANKPNYGQQSVFLMKTHQEPKRGTLHELGPSSNLVRKRNTPGSLYSSIPFESNNEYRMDQEVANNEANIKFSNNLQPPFRLNDMLSQRGPRRNRSIFADSVSQTMNQGTYEDLRSKVELSQREKQDLDSSIEQKPETLVNFHKKAEKNSSNPRFSIRTKTIEKKLSLIGPLVPTKGDKQETPLTRRKISVTNPPIYGRSGEHLELKNLLSYERLSNKNAMIKSSVGKTETPDSEPTSIRLIPDSGPSIHELPREFLISTTSLRRGSLSKVAKPSELDQIEEAFNEDNDTNQKKTNSKKYSGGNGQKVSSGTEGFSAGITQEEALKKQDSIRNPIHNKLDSRRPIHGFLEVGYNKHKFSTQRKSVKHPTTAEASFQSNIYKSNSFTDFATNGKHNKNLERLYPNTAKFRIFLEPHTPKYEGTQEYLVSDDSRLSSQVKLFQTTNKRSSGSSKPKQEVSQIQEEDHIENQSSSDSHPSSQIFDKQSRHHDDELAKNQKEGPQRPRRISIKVVNEEDRLPAPKSKATSRLDTSMFQPYPFTTPNEELHLRRNSIGSASRDSDSDDKLS